MTVDQSLNRIVEQDRKLRMLSERLDAMQGPSQGGGGGSMEGRITRLEQRVDALVDRTAGVESGLAVVKERLSHMPTKVELWTVAATVIGTLGAIVLLADRIKAFLS